MIKFTDTSVYLKGTGNAIVSDPQTGDIFFQSSQFTTGSITPSVNLNEIRAGVGNPIVAMIPSDAAVAVDFDSAAFSLPMKAAQLGASLQYSAPSQVCQTVNATSTSLAVDITTYAPTAPLGMADPICFVQEVGAASFVGVDGTAYDINPTTGVISGFTATSGKTYKVWYYAIKPAAQYATITSLIDPKVVRFEVQFPVFSNKTSSGVKGTRIGYMYVTIPYLKLQADAAVNGDQGTADTTKVSGQAIAYESDVVTPTCADGDEAVLAYYTYVPDNAAGNIVGLAVVGGVVEVVRSTSEQVPVRLVMADGSLANPGNFANGFTYTLTGAPSGTTVSNSGVITAGTTAGDCDLTIQYANGDETLTCTVSVSVVAG